MNDRGQGGPSQFVFYSVDIRYKQDPVVEEKTISVLIRFLSGNRCFVSKTLDYGVKFSMTDAFPEA